MSGVPRLAWEQAAAASCPGCGRAFAAPARQRLGSVLCGLSSRAPSVASLPPARTWSSPGAFALGSFRLLMRDIVGTTSMLPQTLEAIMVDSSLVTGLLTPSGVELSKSLSENAAMGNEAIKHNANMLSAKKEVALLTVTVGTKTLRNRGLRTLIVQGGG